jgi:sugar/nucleoside kinase (ribokinase family)
MRIISFGDLYLDYYFKDNQVIGICGGKTNANIIANLAKYYHTAFIGCAGNDFQGTVAIESLKKLNVDVSLIDRIDCKTKVFFIDQNKCSQICPICHRELSYHGLKFNINKVLNNIQKDDYIVIDNINLITLEIINNVSNKAFLDIGYLKESMYSSLDETLSLLKGRFEIINMNERVYKALNSKFKIDELKLYEILRPKILLITKGKKGVDIIHNGIIKKITITNPAKDVETSGAGDAFFSEFIRTYLEINEVNDYMLDKAYERASLLSRKVVSKYGARAHIEPLYKITNYQGCICEDIEVQ